MKLGSSAFGRAVGFVLGRIAPEGATSPVIAGMRCRLACGPVATAVSTAESTIAGNVESGTIRATTEVDING